MTNIQLHILLHFAVYMKKSCEGLHPHNFSYIAMFRVKISRFDFSFLPTERRSMISFRSG